MDIFCVIIESHSGAWHVSMDTFINRAVLVKKIPHEQYKTNMQ